MRNLLSFSVILFAVSRVGAYGAVAQATNEIMRQTYIFALTCLAALDACVQSLVAAYLGKVTTACPVPDACTACKYSVGRLLH